MLFTAYIDELHRILNRIASEQSVSIARAGVMLASAIERGGVGHVFGSGHSHMIAEEAFFRAGGLIPINPVLDQRLAFFDGALESTRAEREEGYVRTLLARQHIELNDVAIVASNSGRNAAPIEFALEMKARGVDVIAITNVAQSSRAASRHSSGKRLFELGSVVIDTFVPEGDAILRFPGIAYSVGPASTVAGAAIVNSIMIEAAAELARAGKAVPVFPSANSGDITEEDLLEMCRPYRDRIRYLNRSENLP
jgi:uncharacterized phosphosugar-binding protein